jgi:hypothetical protein
LAVKSTLVALAGTVTVLGIVTAERLLDRFTFSPPLGAAAFSVIVQASVPDPVMAPLVQYSALSTAVPVPLRLINAVPFAEELLLTVS